MTDPFKTGPLGSDVMIERARKYVWDTARVLEQRRFELLTEHMDVPIILDDLKNWR